MDSEQKEESKKKVNKKVSKKKHNEVNNEEVADKKGKKASKKSKKEDIKTKSVEDVEVIEEMGEVEVENDDEIVEGSIFRTIPEEIEIDEEEEKEVEHKMEDIVWSDKKFPKI